MQNEIEPRALVERYFPGREDKYVMDLLTGLLMYIASFDAEEWEEQAGDTQARSQQLKDFNSLLGVYRKVKGKDHPPFLC